MVKGVQDLWENKRLLGKLYVIEVVADIKLTSRISSASI